MGLIKAATGAAGGSLADQWREFIYCESMPADVLAVKGQKRASGRSSNVHGEDNIISNGSVVAVNDGQCMLIVQQGAIVDICAEPGEYTFDLSTEPSLFYGGLQQGILDTFAQIGRRFSFGGDAGKDQRVYFINTKEIMGNKYGTASPVPFRVVDTNIGLDVDISVRCNGEYSYRITNPLLFYKNVCGNVQQEYTRSNIDSQLKSLLLTALQPAFARISAMGVRYSAVPAHTSELADILNDELSEEWRDLRGIEIVSFGINSISAPPEDEQMIKDLQKAATMRDPSMRDAVTAAAAADAMRTAAANEGGMGAMGGFIGMNMASQAGAANMSGGNFAPNPPQTQYTTAANGGFGQPQAAPAAGEWTCASCGTKNTGKFCMECGQPKPAPAGEWICTNCGTKNAGKFCMECGQPMPAAAPAGEWTCSCGVTNTGKFCANCGSPRP